MSFNFEHSAYCVNNNGTLNCEGQVVDLMGYVTCRIRKISKENLPDWAKSGKLKKVSRYITQVSHNGVYQTLTALNAGIEPPKREDQEAQ